MLVTQAMVLLKGLNQSNKRSGWKVKRLQEPRKESPLALIQALETYPKHLLIAFAWLVSNDYIKYKDVVWLLTVGARIVE